MITLLRFFKGIWFWTMGVIVTALAIVGCAVMHGVTRLGGRPLDGRLVHPIAGLWGRTVFRLTPGWRISVEGKEHLPPPDGRPVVLVANHESMADIFVMYFLGPIQFRWLSKAEVFAIPGVGQAMRWCRYVPVRRGERDSHAAAMRESEARMREDAVSMLYFPEGTRSTDGKLKEFKLGAFRLARDVQAPVVPIVLRGTGELMPKHGRVPKSARVRIKVLPQQPPPAPGEELEAYASRVRGMIAAEHERL